MRELLQKNGLKDKIDLAYMDPPFFSKVDYGTDIKISSDVVKKMPVIRQHAYYDTWDNGMEDYLIMLTARFFMIRDLLSRTGSFFIHLDWHVVHYVKIILDEVFGEKNFINELIWQYKSGGISKRYFGRKHDTLLFYTKTPNYYFEPQFEKSYNRAYKPYRFKGVKEYRDDLGWYTMVNMKDVWQIDMVGRTSGERTGYATQKPEALIRRILESCTSEGDLCADFFCGAGTLAATAHKMNRRWIACDMGSLAVTATEKRLAKEQGAFALLVEKGLHIKGTGLLTLRGEFPETPFTDKILLRLSLEDYRLHVEDLPLEDESKDVVDSILTSDPLQLIDYWSVDFDYDGMTHRPTMYFAKGKDKIETVCEKIHDRFTKVSLRICDVFGNSYFHVLDMTEHHHE
jgi:adenine specific DNA methylase Mod